MCTPEIKALEHATQDDINWLVYALNHWKVVPKDERRSYHFLIVLRLGNTRFYIYNPELDYEQEPLEKDVI
jgi:hypothetical protein